MPDHLLESIPPSVSNFELDHVKAPGIGRSQGGYISILTPFAIVQPRELWHGTNSKLLEGGIQCTTKTNDRISEKNGIPGTMHAGYTEERRNPRAIGGWIKSCLFSP